MEVLPSSGVVLGVPPNLRQHLRELNAEMRLLAESDKTLVEDVCQDIGKKKREAATGKSESCTEDLPQLPQPRRRVSLEDFQILRLIGRGAYGKVFQVRRRSDGSVFAMKCVNKSRVSGSRTDLRHTRTERDVLARVTAAMKSPVQQPPPPFLVGLESAFETRHRLYLVQEFCRGGELFRLMEEERMFLEDEARFYLCEIACALSFLHSMDIVYRDLKTENVMLDAEGHVKLIDFGLSKQLLTSDELTHTFCGTVEYMAPEVVSRSPGHGKPADWWSFGVFAFDLLTGRSPFHSHKGKAETKARILRGRFTVPAFLSPDATDLMRRLLRKKAERRLGSRGPHEVKEHAFFADVDWDLVEARAYKPPHVPSFSDPDDEEDLSHFDPRFTEKSPRQSFCVSKDGTVEADGPMTDQAHALFKDFDYVSEGHVQVVEEEDNENNKHLLSMISDMHLRGRGD